MSLVSLLSGASEPCADHQLCDNGPTPIWSGKCESCRFASKFPGPFDEWKSLDGISVKHPSVVAAKKASKIEQINAKRAAKAARDRSKMKTVAAAKRAEQRTNNNIIKATKNSGRSNRDADHVVAGSITLDTKNQSVINPTVKVFELEKVRQDARRGGNPIGGLILRNSNGHGFVVLAEEDFAKLVKGLR